MYCLKQSPKAWFERFGKVIKLQGYIQSQVNHTMFYKHSREGKIVVLIVYVDSIILIGDDSLELERLKKALTREFEIKDVGPLRYFIGMEFARSKKGIFISQRKYILDLLSETGTWMKAIETPIEPNLKLQPASPVEVIDKEKSMPSWETYLSLSYLSRYCFYGKHGESIHAVYRILRYLKGTPRKGLPYENRGHL